VRNPVPIFFEGLKPRFNIYLVYITNSMTTSTRRRQEGKRGRREEGKRGRGEDAKKGNYPNVLGRSQVVLVYFVCCIIL